MELWNLDSGFQSLAGFQTADTSYKQKFPYMGQVRARVPHLAIFYNKKNLEVLWIRVPPKIRSKAIVRSPSFTALKLTKTFKRQGAKNVNQISNSCLSFNSILTHWTTPYMYYRRGRRKHTLARENVFSAGMLQFSTGLSDTFWLVLLHHKFVRVKCTLSLSRIPLSLSHLVGMPEHPNIK